MTLDYPLLTAPAMAVALALAPTVVITMHISVALRGDPKRMFVLGSYVYVIFRLCYVHVIKLNTSLLLHFKCNAIEIRFRFSALEPYNTITFKFCIYATENDRFI